MCVFRILEETRLFRTWLEDYEVSENIHSQGVAHIRDAEGSYDYEQGGTQTSGNVSALGAGGSKGKKGKGKGRGKGKEAGPVLPAPAKPAKKEKTEDQLARAAL